ncbi:PPE domain-containing protein [Nocardia australiensis]|uniref:PPE domain-containing protein n=1 Tax=Nocardia australiensis TaxID=2887191 RepID=UPI001D14D6A2|nr:PPE domain-containing protein [Nocardia australiensis]
MPLPFTFIALPPEINLMRLTTGGSGPAGMAAAAAADVQFAAAMNAAAAADHGSTGVLAAGWQGSSSDIAQTAFAKHTAWLADQAAVASATAAATAAIANAYAGAVVAMPSAVELAAVHINRVTFSMTHNAPALAANEAYYQVLWGRAAATMGVYAGLAATAVASMPPPLTPPMIVTGGQLGGDIGGGGPQHPVVSSMIDKHDQITAQGKSAPGGGTALHDTHSSPGPTSPTNTSHGTGGDPTPHTGTDPAHATPNPADTTPTAPNAEQALPDMSQAAPSLTDTPADGTTSMEQPGFSGTSPYSPTLAGLNGGAGSLVSLGMFRGGLGTMPGASTGFRMPSNWSLGQGTAFGATPNTTPTAGPASRSTPPRGATAPKAQLRRRRDEDRGTSTVFVPGEPQDVPVLEQPPAIGVIEYDDNDGPGDQADDDAA